MLRAVLVQSQKGEDLEKEREIVSFFAEKCDPRPDAAQRGAHGWIDGHTPVGDVAPEGDPVRVPSGRRRGR